MKPYYFIIIYYFIISLEYRFVFGSAKCQYDNINRFGGYTCRLTIDNLNGKEDLAEISGIHSFGKSDQDVIAILKSKILNFTTLSPNFCEKFNNVERFTFSKSGIKEFDENAFKDCEKLKKFIFDENEIREIPENLFVNNPDLDAISLMYNQLTTIHENTFANNPKITVINLLHNKIKILPGNVFKSLTNLQNLILAQNEIEDLKPELFSSLSNLQNLLLDDNKISNLPKNIFASLTKLNTLMLTSNSLTVIDSASFGVHRQLATVSLNKNQIDAVDEKFIDNTQITSFDMRNNLCYSDKLRDVVPGGDEIKGVLKNCFENFERNLKGTEDSETSTTDSTLSINLPAKQSISNTDEILRLLNEIQAEVKILREENRELKLQNENILKIVAKC